MELKQLQKQGKNVNVISFNQTRMELKRRFRRAQPDSLIQPFNQTRMELKQVKAKISC